MHHLLGEALRRRHDPFTLGGAEEGTVLLTMATVGACELELIRQSSVLVVAHLERCVTRRALASEVSVGIDRMATGAVKPSAVCSISPTPSGLRCSQSMAQVKQGPGTLRNESLLSTPRVLAMPSTTTSPSGPTPRSLSSSTSGREVTLTSRRCERTG